jgi:hypothetical protein
MYEKTPRVWVLNARALWGMEGLRISVGTDTYFGLQADSDFGFARTLIPELTGQLYQVSLVLSAKILHVVKLLFSFSARNHLLIPV